ncbi:hypothetical protein Lal_00003968 [Lupinus albus]|nr:hypothetical protein Lal_00003968 [Lupinus albus]
MENDKAVGPYNVYLLRPGRFWEIKAFDNSQSYLIRSRDYMRYENKHLNSYGVKCMSHTMKLSRMIHKSTEALTDFDVGCNMDIGFVASCNTDIGRDAGCDMGIGLDARVWHGHWLTLRKALGNIVNDTQKIYAEGEQFVKKNYALSTVKSDIR